MTFSHIINSIATKPFIILTGNSGTGKTKIAELFAQWLRGKKSEGYVLVAVGADWTDNRNVLGFVNYLRSSSNAAEALPVYQSTPILDLLLKSAEDPYLPYFLILDEMNLSHVERYFADFLSAMESKTGELLLHKEGAKDTKLPTKAGGEALVPQRLAIPDNFFVVGTVNVDETTYMFSPKVLDRANVIEFRTSRKSLEDFLASGSSSLGDMEQADPSYAHSFLKLSRSARSGALPDYPKPSEGASASDAIQNIFEIMSGARHEFGFRTVNEILRYLRVDYALTENKTGWDWKNPFDSQILQKILPKLHGSKRKIENLLLHLALFCETGKPASTDSALPAHLLTNPVKPLETPVFENSYKKLCDMIDTVRRDQFVSFIQ